MLSFLDGFRVAPSVFEDDPAVTIWQEFCRQLAKPQNIDKIKLPLITEPSGRQLSYEQLRKMAQRLVVVLRRHAVVKNEDDQKPVAVFLPPGCARIAALLALNCLGVPFVPLDNVQTNDQRKYILEHSHAQAVILDNERVALLKESKLDDCLRLIVIDNDCSDKGSDDDFSQVGTGQTVCLTLYTSGSTGAPKGIMLTDANLLNRLRWQWAELPFSSDEVCLAKTNNLFVDSYTEILGSILRLQRLVIVDPNAWTKDPSSNVAVLMADAIEKHRVTRLILVPSLLCALLELPDAAKRLASLRLVVSSGEALSSELAKRFFHVLENSSPSQPRLANFYGSTEVTGDVTAAIFASSVDVAARTVDGFVSMGRPIHNTTVYIVEEKTLRPVPLGEIGHIYVSGENVCKGFAGESKVLDRFRDKQQSDSAGIGIGSRLLGMGDIGRIVPGGELVYCGRSDSIVKIRGNRVSTAQVEEALKEVLRFVSEKKPSPSSKQVPRCRVVAIDHMKSATCRLAAFYEEWPEALQCLRPDNVRKELYNRLPSYSVPELLFPLQLGTFPLQPHTGKTDQRALKRMAEEACDKAVVQGEVALGGLKTAGSGDLQSAIEAVRRVAAFTLGITPENIVMDATFCNQGGNSLSVIAAVVELNKIGYKNASAELLLAPGKTLGDVARHLVTDTLQQSLTNFSMPPWLEFKNVADLTEKEKHRCQTRLDYSFTLVEPLGRLLNLRPSQMTRQILACWPAYAESGSLSFVAFDRRRPGEDAVVGCCLCADVTVEPDDFTGIEAIMYILMAAEEPLRNELLKQYSVDHFPPGLILSQRMMYVEYEYPDDDATNVFFAMEKEIIARARKAGFKTIMSENSNYATQTIERELLGYKERSFINVHELTAPNGIRPFIHAPKDCTIRGVSLDL